VYECKSCIETPKEDGTYGFVQNKSTHRYDAFWIKKKYMNVLHQFGLGIS
jgi:hypothetical protein